MLLEKPLQLFGSVNTQPSDYTGREINTPTKERPSGSDFDNINNVVTEIFNQNLISPIENPFGYLWLANCILYLTVAAYLLLKGWKKPSTQGGMKTKDSDKAKRFLEEKAKELCRKISIAKSELEKLRKNRKLRKKGRKDRALLFEECKFITSPELVNYMEKTKAQLRKLKLQFIRNGNSRRQVVKSPIRARHKAGL